jgi:dTDP-4-amino-4,6-dideoxygalactose transaminase
MKLISYGRQYVDNQDILSVSASLKADKLTTGNKVKNFEKKISNFLKCKFSSTCNSGTSALFLAMQAIKIKKNDKIIMPSVNFISSYNIAKLFNAKIFLADVDKNNGQMTPKNIEECCKKFNLKKIKAIIVMYNGGYPNNAENFYKFKKKLGCYIIEDSCHALGAEYIYKNKTYKIGSCAHSDISTFSLHPLKTITTGEGGIVTTNSKTLDERMKSFRSLGIKRNKNKHWEYDVVHLGFNFRLTDIQSSLGISQLNKINKFIKHRKNIASFYNKELCKIPKLSIPKQIKQYKSSFHLYILNIESSTMKQKESFIKYMLKKNIMIQYHYIPIYKFKIFKDKYYGINSEIYYRSSVSLPIYFGLRLKEQKYIIESIKKFFKK